MIINRLGLQISEKNLREVFRILIFYHPRWIFEFKIWKTQFFVVLGTATVVEHGSFAGSKYIWRSFFKMIWELQTQPKIVYSKAWSNSVADLHSKILDACPPPVQLSSFSYRVSSKFGQIIGYQPFLGWRPRSVKSWIRRCKYPYQRVITNKRQVVYHF